MACCWSEANNHQLATGCGDGRSCLFHAHLYSFAPLYTRTVARNTHLNKKDVHPKASGCLLPPSTAAV